MQTHTYSGPYDGERFVGSPINLPWPILFLMVLCSAPIGITLFSAIDQPLYPPEQSYAPITGFVFSDANTPPTTQYVDIAEYDEHAPSAGRVFNPWFRVQADVASVSSEQAGIFLPMYASTYAIYVNDIEVGRVGKFDPPYLINKQPQLFPVTKSQLVEADGTIYIRAIGESRNTGPTQVYVGDYSELISVHGSWQFLQVSLPWYVVIAVFLVCVAMFVLWILSPKHTFYGWLALTTLLGAAHSAHALWEQPPFGHVMWHVTGRLTLFVGVAAVLFLHRYFAIHWPRTERTVLCLLAIPGLVLLYAGISDDLQMYLSVLTPYTLVSASITIYTTAFICFALYRFRNLEALLIACCLMSNNAVIFRDVMFQLNQAEGSFYYLQYGTFVNTLMYGYLLLRRFVGSMREVDELNTDLERRVEQKAQELENSYARLSQAEHERAIAEERARIVRDMHDGLGGQLVHTMALADKGENVRDAVQTAIEDLRLIIDSFSPDDHSFGDLIASFRHRVTRHVEHAGMDIHWHVPHEFEFDLPSTHSLDLLRLTQEAITNAIKHSQASSIDVTIQPKPSNLLVSVADNGIGLKEGRHDGRGLKNMRSRAHTLGGNLSITSGENGTTVTCVIPLSVEQTKADSQTKGT